MVTKIGFHWLIKVNIENGNYYQYNLDDLGVILFYFAKFVFSDTLLMSLKTYVLTQQLLEIAGQNNF